MKKLHVILAAAALAFAGAGHAALAQSSPTGNMQSPTLQPKPGPDPNLPPALPGVAEQQLQNGPNVVKPQSGDPTAELFTAINGNDYGSAQDAVSRGADLDAQDSLGETPIDLSVELNRNSITFLLLAVRNESGGNFGGTGSNATPLSAMPTPRYGRKPGKSQAVPVRLVEKPHPMPEAGTGTPNTGAGFLGFNN